MRKTLSIPIYDAEVTVVVTKNVTKVAIEAGYSGDMVGKVAMVLRYPDNPGEYVVIFHKEAISPGNIAHEALHLLHDIMENVGMGPELNDDEAQAYLIGFIVNGIHQIIYKK